MCSNWHRTFVYVNIADDIVYVSFVVTTIHFPFNHECDLPHSTIYRLCNNMSNTTASTGIAGSTCSSGSPEITPVFDKFSLICKPANVLYQARNNGSCYLQSVSMYVGFCLCCSTVFLLFSSNCWCISHGYCLLMGYDFA